MSVGPGLIAPLLTPFAPDGSIAIDLFVEHARRLLDQGCVAVTPFGTTGEGPSIGYSERMSALEGLIEGGIPPTRIIAATGTAGLADTISITRHAEDLECIGALVLPAFYFKTVSDEGIRRYFAEVAEAVTIPIFLYHIPQVAGIGVPISVVESLFVRFGHIVGIKDSSGQWDNTGRLFDIDGLTVYPGSEVALIKALERGGPGCISATANINASAISGVIADWNGGFEDRAAKGHARAVALRHSVEQYPVIPALKQLVARTSGDRRWLDVRPPLTQLEGPEVDSLLDDLSSNHGRRWPSL